MKRFLILAALGLTAAGCTTVGDQIDRARFGENPYLRPPFYSRYLDPRVRLDQQIQQRVTALAANPDDPVLHNELGALLVQKGFPNDATREFRRAIYADRDFYPAWYNLALVHHARGNTAAAVGALHRTISLKPGHAAAHFQLGLIHEQRGRTDAAVDSYARAFAINPNLLEVGVNPRILDSKLVDLALLKRYGPAHKTKSIQFQGTPRDYSAPVRPEAPSRQPAPEDIVTPAPPPTEEGVQPSAPAPTPQ
jgi:tetratricopeptide (TPR) repeat protein